MTTPHIDDLKRYLELSEYVEFTDSKGRLLHSIKSEKLLLPFLAHEQLQSKVSELQDKLYHESRRADEIAYLKNQEIESLQAKLKVAEDAILKVLPKWHDEEGFQFYTHEKILKEALDEIRKKDDNG